MQARIATHAHHDVLGDGNDIRASDFSNGDLALVSSV